MNASIVGLLLLSTFTLQLTHTLENRLSLTVESSVVSIQSTCMLDIRTEVKHIHIMLDTPMPTATWLPRSTSPAPITSKRDQHITGRQVMYMFDDARMFTISKLSPPSKKCKVQVEQLDPDVVKTIRIDQNPLVECDKTPGWESILPGSNSSFQIPNIGNEQNFHLRVSIKCFGKGFVKLRSDFSEYSDVLPSERIGRLVSQTYCTQGETTEIRYEAKKLDVTSLTLVNHATALIEYIVEFRSLRTVDGLRVNVDHYITEFREHNLKEAHVSPIKQAAPNIYPDNDNIVGFVIVGIALFVILIATAALVTFKLTNRQRESALAQFRSDLFEKSAPRSPFSKVRKTFSETAYAAIYSKLLYLPS